MQHRARAARRRAGRGGAKASIVQRTANSSKRFVTLPPSPLEQREKLEQLRALEAGMRIDVTIVDSVPLGVDTPEDLDRARAILASGGANVD